MVAHWRPFCVMLRNKVDGFAQNRHLYYHANSLTNRGDLDEQQQLRSQT